MGGYGSTRWDYHSKNDTVEDCRSLDVSSWVREGILRENYHTFGGCHWRNSFTGEQTSAIGYEINTLNMNFPWVRLFYTFTQTGEQADYKIRLTTTYPNFGGLRWWFICPLVRNGMGCNRRVGKIHLPPSGRYFGCRHCYDLTYKSCQESDKRVSWLRRNPEAFMAMSGNLDNLGPSKLFLLLKAMR